MPIDGVLVATAAMATLEATTSPEVKQLLVDTPGTPDWIGAGTAVGGMASSRSQLGADIHEIDNTASQTGRLLDEVAGDAEAIEARRDEIIEALNRTSKPYFGDVDTMTYAQWLARFLELSGTPAWLDVTLRDRFHAMLQRAEARLNEADHGDVPTLFATSADVEDGAASLALLLQTYPAAEDVILHPADVPFFVTECKRLGKPVNFVPVIDADIRRWWRSDSLWQAHEARYAADGVCVIPGPVSVAGIDRVDEPVADLLRRFESAVVDDVAGRWPCAARRDRSPTCRGRLRRRLARAGRPGRRLGRSHRPQPGPATRRRLGPRRRRPRRAPRDRCRHRPGRLAPLSCPCRSPATARCSRCVSTSATHAATGAVPVITTDDAATAMRSLTATAAAGITPSVEDGRATVDVAWDPDLVADHAGVVGVDGTALTCPTCWSGSPGLRCSPRSPTRPPTTATPSSRACSTSSTSTTRST